jgi:hypothetical protein
VITNVEKPKRLQQAHNMIHMIGRPNHMYRVLVRNSYKKVPLGGLRMKWENKRMALREML